MISRSDLVIPGPAFRGILSPAEAVDYAQGEVKQFLSEGRSFAGRRLTPRSGRLFADGVYWKRPVSTPSAICDQGFVTQEEVGAFLSVGGVENNADDTVIKWDVAQFTFRCS